MRAGELQRQLDQERDQSQAQVAELQRLTDMLAEQAHQATSAERQQRLAAEAATAEARAAQARAERRVAALEAEARQTQQEQEQQQQQQQQRRRQCCNHPPTVTVAAVATPPVTVAVTPVAAAHSIFSRFSAVRGAKSPVTAVA